MSSKYCQARSPNPNPQGPAPTQSNPVKISSKGTGADTKILWVQTEASSTTECHNGVQSQGGQWREKYRVVHHVQEEHYEGHHEP